MHVLLTGTPGSGKTTLVNFARSKGDGRFFDTDEIDGLNEWRDFKTGEVKGLVTEFIEDGTDEWYKQYGWFWRPKVLEEFLATQEDLVLCGSSENVTELYHLFDAVAILVKEETELILNLQSPERNNPFGKTTVQRANFMNWQDHLLREAASFAPLLIHGNDTKAAYNKILAEYFD